MMLIKDLFENNRANIYHSTFLKQGLNIIKTNEITAHTEHSSAEVDPSLVGRSFRQKDMRDSYLQDKARGVSLSRSLYFAKKWKKNGIIFVLDANKLSHNKRIVQIDYYSDRNKGEAEEFVIGSITNLEKYLVSIMISQRTYNSLPNLITEDPKHSWELIYNHPKLKIY